MEEIRRIVREEQPNICQIAAYKDNKKVYSDCWNNYEKEDCTHII